HVNSCWMCDYGRLNFKYLEAENRILEPQISNGEELVPSDWKSAIAHAALQLRQFSGANVAIIASGRMTNEELWLTRKIAELLGARYDGHFIERCQRIRDRSPAGIRLRRKTRLDDQR